MSLDNLYRRVDIACLGVIYRVHKLISCFGFQGANFIGELVDSRTPSQPFDRWFKVIGDEGELCHWSASCLFL